MPLLAITRGIELLFCSATIAFEMSSNSLSFLLPPCLFVLKSGTSVKIYFGDYNTGTDEEEGEFNLDGKISMDDDNGACLIKTEVNLGWFSKYCYDIILK